MSNSNLFTPAGDVISKIEMVWPGQREFLESEAHITAMLTGAGYGKSRILCERIIKDHARQDYWWQGRAEYNTNPLIFMVGAAHEQHLADNTVPLFRANLDRIEAAIGRSLRKRTGRNRDGWFGSLGHRRQEMANCVDIIFKSFPTKENAVAVTVAGLYFDEVTMFKDVEIWRRSMQRVRDPRVVTLPNGKPSHFVCAVGTPEEDHFIHDVLIDSVTGKPFPGVRLIMDASIKNPVLPDSWFETAGRQTSRLFKEMQVMGRWVRGAGGQRFANVFDADKHVVHLRRPTGPSGIKFDIGWDPGYRTGSVIVAWQRPRDGVWFLIDEIVITDMTTQEVCTELLRRGYNKFNIRTINMDPRDDKQRSTSRVTDGQIVRERLGIRPNNKHIGEKTGHLYVRLDVIETLLTEGKLFISDSLLPKAANQLGMINALKNFATRKADQDPEQFIDKPTRDSLERWKHPIDALHYILMQYERGVYTRIVRTPHREQLGEHR